MFAALLSHRPLRTCRSSSVSVLLSRNAGSGGRDSNVCVMFDKILVANRGEIAARVMRTARRMGIRSVAVYSEADRNSMHVAMADEAHCIGPPPANESYLRQDKIMEVAKATGAQAIHPGYGFLSENKNFAELCQREGVEFIGPPSSAIEKMGIKRVSKKIMSESSVPIVPGYFGQDQSDERLKEEAVKLGFPVMLKADLGGGGKGMRTVSNAGEFQTLLEACRSESLKSFSDDKVMVEKFVVHPRHVEVQVFGDKRGNTVHLFERDCSVQRRHQKVIEEAPAPGLREEVKREMCLAAVRAAKAVGYVGAGTVEFIVDADQNFYFMEMNTRLQVEHPVTEMITGADLVEWQLRVAAGEEVPLGQEQLRHTGHAFEARIYAEDPDKNFIPSPGILKHLQAPRPQGVVRIDTGVRQGDEVTTFYDPLIAKLVVWGDNRSLALKRMKEALLQYQVAGVRTNIGFLERVCSNQSFQQGDVHTGFIPQHEKELFSSPAPLTEFQRKQAVLALLALESWTSTASTENDHYSPFSDCSGARLNLHHHRRVTFNAQGSSFDVDVSYDGQGGFELTCDGSEPEKEGAMMEPARGRLSQGEDGNLLLSGFIGDRTVSANLALLDQTLHIFTLDGGYEVELPKASFITAKEADVGDVARSPVYSTTVNKVLVRPGDKVSKGSVLITVEGMKMETNILATKDCVIKELLFREKDTVPANSTLVEFEE